MIVALKYSGKVRMYTYVPIAAMAEMPIRSHLKRRRYRMTSAVEYVAVMFSRLVGDVANYETYGLVSRKKVDCIARSYLRH